MTWHSLVICFWVYTAGMWICGFMIARSIYRRRVDLLEEKLEIERLLGTRGGGPTPKPYRRPAFLP